MKLLNEMVIKGTPSTRTAQQKGVSCVRNHPHFYEKAEVTLAKQELAFGLKLYAPKQPYEGALYIKVMWLFDKKSLKKSEFNTFRVERPDLDNMAKGLFDVMTDLGFWYDDNQLAQVKLTKGWSRDYPGLFIQIHSLDDSDFMGLCLGWRDQQ